MKEHGLLFQGWGIRAIQGLLKTQTRRLKLRGEWKVGDLIWAKETWHPCACGRSDCTGFIYRADGEPTIKVKWKSAMFMPRKAARNLLKITALYEEPLQSISDDDARAEGVAEYAKLLPNSLADNMTRVEGYRHCIESINGAGFWNANQTLKVIVFERIKQ